MEEMEWKEQNCKDWNTSSIIKKSAILETLFQCYMCISSHVDSGLQCKIYFLLWVKIVWMFLSKASMGLLALHQRLITFFKWMNNSMSWRTHKEWITRRPVICLSQSQLCTWSGKLAHWSISIPVGQWGQTVAWLQFPVGGSCGLGQDFWHIRC